MADRKTLEDLLARVEKASGAEAILDAELAATFGLVPHTFAGSRMVPFIGHGETWPAFTNSIDAALALVERCLPGWTDASDSTNPEDGHDWILFRPASSHAEVGTGKTRPLAILAALLRALISEASDAR